MSSESMILLLNVTGLIVSFLGGILLFLDSLRTGSRFSEMSVFLSYPPFWRHPAWRLAAPVGFIFVTLGFALLLPAAFAATKEQQRKQPKTLYNANRLDSPTQFIGQPWWATRSRTR